MDNYESYRGFASVYDTFMDDLDYEDWAEQADALIRKYGVGGPGKKPVSEEDVLLASERNLVVDLGCGTGRLTELMVDRGYDMMGIDLSEEMLSLALERRDKMGHRTLYLCQDMREFELYGTAGTFLSTGDSINYLTEPGALKALFDRIRTFLYPGGIFIFDFKTLHLYRDIIGENTIAEDREDCSFIWYNHFDEETGINEYDLSVFVLEDEKNRLYRKYEEVHRQRGLTLEEVRATAEEAGLTWLEAKDSDTHRRVTKSTQRIRAVVRK